MMKLNLLVPRHWYQTFPLQSECIDFAMEKVLLKVYKCRICEKFEFKILSRFEIDSKSVEKDEIDGMLLYLPSSPRGSILLESYSENVIVFNNSNPSTYKGWGSFPKYAISNFMANKVIRNPIQGEIKYGDEFYKLIGSNTDLFDRIKENIMVIYHKNCLKDIISNNNDNIDDEIYSQILKKSKWLFKQFYLLFDKWVLTMDEKNIKSIDDFAEIFKDTLIQCNASEKSIGCSKFLYTETSINKKLLVSEYDNWRYFNLGDFYMGMNNDEKEYVGIKIS